MNDQTRDIQDMSDQERKQIAEEGPGGGNMLMNRQAFAQAYQVARLFSSSQLVPQHLQGKPHDCFIALHMADRLGEDPLMVMQNIVIIHGTAGWKAQWLIGRANRSGVFQGRIKFRTEGSGDDLEVTAYATMAETGEEVSAAASMNMAKLEGWAKNAKYQSMPVQMLSYRAASFLIRLYCPEATLGYQSAEEVEDMAASGQMRDVTPGRHTPTEGGAEQALRDLPDEQPPESAPAQRSRGHTEHSESVSAREASAGTTRWDKLDHFGTPWDSRIHAQSMSQNRDGDWRRKRGISDEYYQRIHAGIMNSRTDSEPTGARESDDRAEAGEDTPSGENAGAAAPEQPSGPSADFDTGEVPGESGGPSDGDLFNECVGGLGQVAADGNVEEVERRMDLARGIQNDTYRQQCLEQLENARDRAEGGAGE